MTEIAGTREAINVVAGLMQAAGAGAKTTPPDETDLTHLVNISPADP